MEAAEQPEQTRTATRSGRLLLRMPEELHAELSRVSERKGVSLNAFITATLASAVGLRNYSAGPAAPGRRRARRADAAPQPTRRRLVELLLVANLVIVSAVGVLAIVLLVHALR